MDDWSEGMLSAPTVVVPSAGGARLLGLALERAAPTTWEPPEILAWSTWLARRFERAQRAGEAFAAGAEFLLSPAQERVLWQRALAEHGAPEQAASLAREAWQLAHDWQLGWRTQAGLAEAEDVQAFRRWAASYAAAAAALGATDEARVLAGLPAGAAAGLRLHGFHDATPAQAACFGMPLSLPPSADPACFSGRAFVDRRAEFSAALDWAEALALREPTARVVIAIDSLQQEQALVWRCLRDRHGSAADGRVHLGVRPALATLPSMLSLLAILELAPVSRWDALSQVLRSQHVKGADVESAARAQFDARLRAQARYELPLGHVEHLLGEAEPACPQLATALGALHALRRAVPRRQSLHAWLGHFEQCLRACGWPGDALDDHEQRRALAGWSALRDRLQGLVTVLPPITLADALTRLRQALADSAVAPPSTDSSIFIVTPEEAAWLAPTHLWLAGAEAGALGARARPSPLLPYAAQRAAGVPGSEAGRDLLRTRRLLGLLAAGPGDRIASYSAGDGDQVFSPNPLLPALRTARPDAASPALPAAWRQDPGSTESVIDRYGVPLALSHKLAGGVGVLAAQAACPFRAYARHRLRAVPVAEPLPGLDRRTQGTLVHRVLAYVWLQLGEQDKLLAMTPAARAELVGLALARAEKLPPQATALERELAGIERERVQRLVLNWLEFEAARAPFAVRAAEQAETVEYAGLALDIRIDRIERDAAGAETIVDYKTGQCSDKAWLAPRLDEPQLPFYALTSRSSRLAAIAFARVDSATPQWISLPRGGPGTDESAAAWTAARAAWEADLATLVSGLQAGDAEVAPKHGAQSCRLCEMQRLCRIGERVWLAQDEDDGEAPGDAD